MFALGITMLIAGCILWIITRISSINETRSLAPQQVWRRTVSLEVINSKKKRGLAESWILIGVGLFIVLLTGVFN